MFKFITDLFNKRRTQKITNTVSLTAQEFEIRDPKDNSIYLKVGIHTFADESICLNMRLNGTYDIQLPIESLEELPEILITIRNNIKEAKNGN